MIFLIESIVLCALFTLVIFLKMKNPIKGIASYPTAIRKRVESLPLYQGIIRQEERAHIGKKFLTALILIVFLAFLSRWAGRRTFFETFLHSFGLFTVVNLWDLIVLDWLWFCHSLRVRLPGTEDMVKEYRSPWHHLRGFFIGTAIGAIISLLSAGLLVGFYSVVG